MKTEETILEINLTDLEKNIHYLKSLLKPSTLFLAVVKASSYGNNSVAIASHLQRKGLANYFAVAFASEGIALREAGISLPILVLHPQPIHFDDIIKYQLEPTIYSLRIAQLFLDYASKHELKKYPIHLKCNTGLNRLGFDLNEIDAVLELLKNNPTIEVKTAYSHLAASEDMNEKAFTEKQIETFVSFQEKINNTFSHKVIYHQCNTSGILNYPQAQFDMVRCGVGMYGFANDALLQPYLTPIMTLKSVISQIHTLSIGDSLGYNRGYIADHLTKTATIPVGHADGINRIYGKGKGFVFINGKKAPILGNVCMDMILVEVTDIPCEEGDEVIVFDKIHTAESLAESAGTISYELITSMSHRINRIYIKD
nr:alanine racemase [uncultured Capnocytophaga sp.]